MDIPDLKELTRQRKRAERQIREVERDILEPYVGRKCLSTSLSENAPGTLGAISDEEIPDDYTKEDLYRIVRQNEEWIRLKNELDEIQAIFSTFLEERDLQDESYKSQIIAIKRECGRNLSDWEISKFLGCSADYVRKFTASWAEEGGVREQRPPESTIPDQLRQEVLKRDSSCVRCHTNTDLEVHHIIPVRNGGKPDEENLAVLCQNCHLEAHGGSWNGVRYETRDEFWSWVGDSNPAQE